MKIGGYAMLANKHDMSKFNPKRLSMRRDSMGEYKFWIALGTVLEALLTFWLFLVHWMTQPVRVIGRVVREKRSGS